MATNNQWFGFSNTYHCRICAKLTRETGHGEEDVELCAKCLLECYLENAIGDYGADSTQANRAQKALDEWKAAHPS